MNLVSSPNPVRNLLNDGTNVVISEIWLIIIRMKCLLCNYHRNTEKEKCWKTCWTKLLPCHKNGLQSRHNRQSRANKKNIPEMMDAFETRKEDARRAFGHNEDNVEYSWNHYER
jgi:hypothetical protein